MAISQFKVEAKALLSFSILTLRILIPRVFGYEVEHFVVCFQVENFEILPNILHHLCWSLLELNKLPFQLRQNRPELRPAHSTTVPIQAEYTMIVQLHGHSDNCLSF